ncbi:carbohydrate ABC transporter permease [Virgibacillus halodenitrificans]|uniref:carbohydrate ABC transporter permease n=1 Tax=Virgibacillus halodenitrificans TaxID=1482 RepID=UPI0002DC9CA4|nr:sugar ABC transporter permease [Virgibacillus halodenitrificans]MEC2158345.1 sugar ABC transporter permease [Virgibacillus halodenitrificans]MYL59565.1 ABC transporter permease subunit [Virgibacillus halodenitrificans]WHX26554.1 sugar ABC transporter permease [Virgibacillus halodenitrificans]CDQ31034.1 Lactose transport system permease protein LacF [Virgibacillus halodenitrificans]
MGAPKKKKSNFTRKNRLVAYAFLLPNIIGFLVFIFIPVIASFLMSFTSWNGFGQIEFIGFENYVNLIHDPNFRISFINSILFLLISVPITLFLSMVAAVALNKGIRFVKVFRTAVFLPYVTATVAVAAVWQLVFNPTMGPINGFLSSIGIDNPPGWLTSPEWALFSVSIVYIWHSVGYYMVLYLAGLQSIPKNLYEAADIDGAGPISKFFNVTIPMMSPIIFFTTIIGVINSFKVFDFIFVLTDGGPGRSTHVLVYDIYNTAFKQFEYGYASAMAYVLFLLILIFTFLQYQGQKKWNN